MPDHIQPLPPHPAGRLWLVSLLDEPSAADWQACHADEHAQAARFRFEIHARRYRAAHAALKRILNNCPDTPEAPLTWRLGPHGKPELSGAWQGWHMNLSHSADWALLGLSATAPIGVDIECIKPARDLDCLARHHYTAQEQAALAVLEGEARTRGF